MNSVVPTNSFRFSTKAIFVVTALVAFTIFGIQNAGQTTETLILCLAVTAVLGNLTDSSRRETDQPGIYEAWLRPVSTTNSGPEVRRYVLNVDPNEGETKLMSPQDLIKKVPQSGATFAFWNEFNPNPKQKSASTLTKLLLFVLLALLLLEMVLAYSASYHPARSSKNKSSSPGARSSRVRGAA